MHERITASNDTLLEQAPQTANFYLDHAIGAIDERFGADFAKANPDLVAAYMRACSTDLGGAIIARAIESIGATIKPAIEHAIKLDEDRG